MQATKLNDGKPTTSLEEPVVPTRHNEFYISDELSVFQVQNRLFKVHRHILADNSPVFQDMFAHPVSESPTSAKEEIEGNSDDRPIHLSGVTVLEFESLLEVLYHGPKPFFRLPFAGWFAVLEIAHRFGFKTTYTKALDNLYNPPSEHEALRLIIAAEKYGIDFTHVRVALRILIQRDALLCEREMAQMSYALISRIMVARERCRGMRPRCTRCKSGDAQAYKLPTEVDCVISLVWNLTSTSR